MNQESEILDRRFGQITNTIEGIPSLWMIGTMEPNHVKNVHPEFYKLFENLIPFDVCIHHTYSHYKIQVKPEIVWHLSQRAKEPSIIVPYFQHKVIYPNCSMTDFCGIFSSVEMVYPFGNDPTEFQVTTEFFVNQNFEFSDQELMAVLDKNKTILNEDKNLIEHWSKNYNIRAEDNEKNPRILHYRQYLKEMFDDSSVSENTRILH